jgi:hypothetical protein
VTLMLYELLEYRLSALAGVAGRPLLIGPGVDGAAPRRNQDLTQSSYTDTFGVLHVDRGRL